MIAQELQNVPDKTGAAGQFDPGQTAIKKDAWRILSALDAAEIANIFGLRPTLAELEEAIIWSCGDAYLLGRRTLTGNAAKIFDIIRAARDDDNE